MESKLTHPDTPRLLFLEEENNTTSFFWNEFKNLAPQWEIIRVHDLLSALRHLTYASEPQAFVIDLAVLDEAGMEWIEWVKTKPQFRSLPLVVLSDPTDPSFRQRCITLDATAYLQKPKSLKELRNNIHYIVQLCEGARFQSKEWAEAACV